MSLITDEMVEKAHRLICNESQDDYRKFADIVRAALEAVANDIIEACAVEADDSDIGEEAAERIRALKSKT